MMRQGGDAFGWAIPGSGVGRIAESAIPRAIAKPAEEFASRSEKIYNRQTKATRSIFDDYQGAVKVDDNEKLLIDARTGRQLSDPETGKRLYEPEGRHFGGGRVVGRSTVGGEDIAILPEEYAALTKAAIGQGYTAVEARALPKGVVGKHVVAPGPNGSERSIYLLKTLSKEAADKVEPMTI